MSIEAMKQALEALDGLSEPYDVLKAQDALRTAIAEAEKQEPVAWRHEKFYEGASGWFYADWHSEGLNPPSAQLLYTTPPAARREWVGLTDEQINQYDYEYRDLLYDVEKMLRENNA